MATTVTRLVAACLIIVCTTAQQKSKSTDDFAAFNASLGGMDYIWIVYAIIAILLSFFCIVPGCLCNSWCQSEKYDALSEKCYTDIINARGYNAECKSFGDNRPLSLLVLRQDLKEKQIWHHDWKKDFAVFLRNEHALFSTCFSHPSHPFSRRDRRCILLSVILLDFGIAMFITYVMTFVSFSEVTGFILDYAISYIFASIMTTLESFLVAFAVCAGAEKCPTCVRVLCKCCSSIIIASVLMWAFIGFMIAVMLMVKLAQQDDTSTFWEVFGFNFALGLIQAWFLIDFIKMGFQFRRSWKDAHPLPPGPERDEDEKKKASAGHKCLLCSFCLFCFPIWLLIQCCCRKKEKADPYDDGQDDFGVNYKEYLKWKSGEEIGDRKFPQSYAAFSTAGLAKAVDQQMHAVNQKVGDVKQGVTKTGNKLAMQMRLGKKKKEPVASQEEVELVVDQ